MNAIDDLASHRYSKLAKRRFACRYDILPGKTVSFKYYYARVLQIQLVSIFPHAPRFSRPKTKNISKVSLFILMPCSQKLLIKIPPDIKMYLTPSKVPAYQTPYPSSSPPLPTGLHSSNPEQVNQRKQGGGKYPMITGQLSDKFPPPGRF